MPQGILSWSTCRWHECRSACWRISGFSSCLSPSQTPAPAAPSFGLVYLRSRTRSAPVRSHPHRCNCRPSSWAEAEVGCTHREAVDTGKCGMVLSCVQIYTDIPFLLTKAEEGTSLGNSGCWDERMELGSSFLLLHFHVCKTQSGRERGCLWKRSFGWSMYQGVSRGWTCTLKLTKSEKRAEGIHKEECIRLAPFEKKSLGYNLM